MRKSVSPAVVVIVIVIALAIVAAAGWKIFGAKDKDAPQKPSGSFSPEEIKAKRAAHKGPGPPIGPDGKTPAGGTPPMGGGPMASPGGPSGAPPAGMRKGG